MKCQECHENTATLHFTKIINGKKTETHLCERCAKEKGEAFSSSSGFSMNDLLSGLLNIEYPLGDAQNKDQYVGQQLKCEKCGLSYELFSKRGRFGCAHCYKTFKSKIDPILRRVHSGNTKHGGKIPKRIGGNIHIRNEITELKNQLKQCITSEEFEKAAELRDKVRSLEKKLSVDGEGDT